MLPCNFVLELGFESTYLAVVLIDQRVLTLEVKTEQENETTQQTDTLADNIMCVVRLYHPTFISLQFFLL